MEQIRRSLRKWSHALSQIALPGFDIQLVARRHYSAFCDRSLRTAFSTKEFGRCSVWRWREERVSDNAGCSHLFRRTPRVGHRSALRRGHAINSSRPLETESSQIDVHGDPEAESSA